MRERYKACGAKDCCFTDDRDYVKSLEADRDYVKVLEARVKLLEGDILFVMDRWWPFVHRSVSPSNCAYNGGRRLRKNLNDPIWRKAMIKRLKK